MDWGGNYMSFGNDITIPVQPRQVPKRLASKRLRAHRNDLNREKKRSRSSGSYSTIDAVFIVADFTSILLPTS